MKFPTWISEMEDINDPVISCEIFEKAKLLFDEERFTDSLELLQEGLYSKRDGQNRDGGIKIFKVLFLAGWCLILNREFSKIVVWENFADSLNLKQSPEIILLSIFQLVSHGKFQEVIELGEEFLVALDVRVANENKDAKFNGNVRPNSFVQLGNEPNISGNEYLVLLQDNVFIKVPRISGRSEFFNVGFLGSSAESVVEVRLRQITKCVI